SAATPPPAPPPAPPGSGGVQGGVPGAPARRRLPRLVALSLVLALAAGALLAGAAARRRSGAYAPVAPPGDLREAEKGLNRGEPSLRSPQNVTDVMKGFNLCLELGLFYLEADRLDDADELFSRLDYRYHKVRPYHTLGRLGRAIVLALRNKPGESNQTFREVL